jgi:acyl-CoA dehydrogenase
LGNQYDEDRMLRSYLARVLDREQRSLVEPTLREMGELAGGELYRLQLEDRLREPVLTQWDPWGQRIDHIEITPLWKRAERIACEKGLIATAYEGAIGDLSRVHQFALAYLFDASTDVYTCPLAMTDGAAATLTAHGGPLKDRALPRLVSRDPSRAWTSGQWMTERTGGSDVGLSETVAKEADGAFRLFGTKWFTSATTAQMALTLARPEGNPPGGRGLALFYVEVRDDAGRIRPGISVNRLKDKLGTKKVPTAELTLDGVFAEPVKGLSDGTRNITPMLNITRSWNTVAAVSAMRRAVALARDYSNKRVQFGAPLSDKPLHLDTMAGLQAELEAAFHLSFRAIELLGKHETGTISESEARMLRLLTPLAKLTTGKQAVAVVSEVLECFGGAGYVEDTGLPRLLRDAQVLPIWEGTTNVLSLDALRAIAKDGALRELAKEVHALTEGLRGELEAPARAAREAAEHASRWLEATYATEPTVVEAGARRFALTLGRATALALLVRHAAWAAEHEHDQRPTYAARRFMQHGVDLIVEDVAKGAAELANDVG